jgi:HK97 family phage major capsid protein
MTPAELRRTRAQKIDQLNRLNTLAESETRALTPEEQAQYDTLKAEVMALGERIARIEEAAGLTAAAAAEAECASARSTPIDAGRDPLPWRNPNHPFLITRAIAALMEGRQLSGVEAETTAELAKRYKRPAQGFYLPPTLAHVQTRALDVSGGAGAIVTALHTEFIDLLRNRTLVQTAGATILSDMVGPFGIPRLTAGAAGSWVAEGSAPSTSSQTIDQVAFTPKTVTAFTDITRRFIKQTSLDSEALVKKDLATALAVAIDLGALNGGGTNAPTGLLQNSSVPTVAIDTTGGAPTWAKIVELESKVASYSADTGKLAYMGNSKVRGKLKTTVRDSNTAAVYLWHQGLVNDYPCYVSNQIPSNLTKSTGTALSAMIFGNWEDLIIAAWGAADVIVDPYTGSSAGTVRIVVIQEADVNPRHPESFAKILDMVTT